MIIKFATKRNKYSGRRSTLFAIDTVNKVYSTAFSHWICREDIIETTKSDIERLKYQVKKEGYSRVEYL